MNALSRFPPWFQGVTLVKKTDIYDTFKMSEIKTEMKTAQTKDSPLVTLLLPLTDLRQ